METYHSSDDSLSHNLLGLQLESGYHIIEFMILNCNIAMEWKSGVKISH